MFWSKIYTLKSFGFWLALQMWTCLSNRLVAYVTSNFLMSAFWSSLQVPVTFSFVFVFLRLNWPSDFNSRGLLLRWLVPVLYIVFALSQFLSKSNSLVLFLFWSFHFKRHDIFHGRHWLAALYWESVSMTWFREELDAYRVSSHYTPLVSFNKRDEPSVCFMLGENKDDFRFDRFCLFGCFQH